MRVILCSFSSNFKWAILILSSLGDGSNAFTTFFVTFWEILIWKPPIDLFQVCPERNFEWNKSILSNSLLPSVKFKDRMTSGKKRYSPPFRNSAISPWCWAIRSLCTSGFGSEIALSILNEANPRKQRKPPIEYSKIPLNLTICISLFLCRTIP